MTGEISTWQKAKDTALAAFMGLGALGIGTLISLVMDTKKDIADLKLSLAVYQTQQNSLKEEVRTLKDDHNKLRSDFDSHDSYDRDRFRKVGVR